ncbi:exo-alpha-sialidase [Candidatus Acetothermia bacterium]|nr:exo-alpha-sialidase [Candidatus Acetothermia bacterium]MBI3644340.1 exo-alpha-sialidase [Candidatus Acetothermia bacterium]
MSDRNRLTAAAVAILFLLCSTALLTSGSAYYLNLSKGPGNSLFPAIATSGQNVYVVWDDDRAGDAEEIFFSRSTDGGVTFSDPQNLSHNSGASRNPAVAASGDDVYVVWEDESLGSSEIFYLVSRDGGATFSVPMNISQNAGSSTLPDLALVNGVLYVAWQDETFGNSEILLSSSFDRGQSFLTARNLSQSKGLSWSPAIAADGTDLYVVWEEGTQDTREIYFTGSLNGGVAFTAPKVISGTAMFATAPAVAALGGHLYVTWTQEMSASNYDIFLTQSADRGQSLTQPENISKSQSYSGASVIALSPESVQLAWVEGVVTAEADGKSFTDYEIYSAPLARSSGSSKAQPQNVSETHSTSVNPVIALAPGGLYIAWADYTAGNFEILFAQR